MSVVGPRPHMVRPINALTVDKFMVRHFIKPGIQDLLKQKVLEVKLRLMRILSTE
jgi:putative colanic acid biosynthesis UDP-glucose lipid carrier transferase